MTGDYLAFIRELPKSFGEIGAMLPSSPALGRKMVRPIEEAGRPLSILEVGPGTGPFTRQILRRMGPRDTLTICEINARFMNRLKVRLENDPYFQRNRARVIFFQGAVQQLPAPSHDSNNGVAKFDIIVSSLPFSNFTPDTVEEILELFQKLTGGTGTVTFLEYIGLRPLARLISSRSRRERAAGVEKVIKEWRNRITKIGFVSTDVALLNVPPAVAIRFDFSKESAFGRENVKNGHRTLKEFFAKAS